MSALSQMLPSNKPNLSPSQQAENTLNFYQTHQSAEQAPSSAQGSSEKKYPNRKSIIVLKGGVKHKSGPI